MPQSKEWVVVVIPSWSHHASVQAMMAECLRHAADLRVTVICHALMESKVRTTWHASFSGDITSRLKTLAVGSPDIAYTIANWGKLVAEVFTQAVPALKALDRQPDRYILPMLGGIGLVPQIKEMNPRANLWGHWAASCGWLWWLLDGAGDYKQILAEMMSEDPDMPEEKQTELKRKLIFAANGTTEVGNKVLKVPGLDQLYAYELHADNGGTPPVLLDWMAQAVDLSYEIEGVMIATSPLIENDLIHAFPKRLKVVPTGLTSTPANWEGPELAPGPVKAFLDIYDDATGVIYICFGSVYFPKEWTHELFETLLDLKRPFILNYVLEAPLPVSADLVHRLKTSATCLFNTDFLDQIGVLNHSATKWILGQGGWNSLSEAIIAGVPFINWPFGNNDQPYHAALFSTQAHPIGFEVMNIRKDSRPSHRGVRITSTSEAVRREWEAILAATLGEEGKVRRRNVKALRDKIREENNSDGNQMLKDFCNA